MIFDKLCGAFPFVDEMRTIVHVGAHLGQEVEDYYKLGFRKIVLIEASPDTYEKLVSRISGINENIRRSVIHLQCLVSCQDDEFLEFYEFDNEGASSSIYKSTKLKRDVCKVAETGRSFRLKTFRLDTLLTSLGILPNHLSALVVDVQGAEFNVLLGCGVYLKYPHFIDIEVSKYEYYDGAPLYNYVEKVLDVNGFKRVTPVPNHNDCLFVNKRSYLY